MKYPQNTYVIPGLKIVKPLSDAEVIERIKSAIIEITGFEWQELLLKNRSRNRVTARHITFYIIREKLPHYTLMSIGKLFNKDHTTIIYGIQNIQNLLQTKNALTVEWYNAIKLQLW
jgi:chromosomal replication initiation ATPase DnaA